MQRDESPVPQWFVRALGLMFACYPQATVGELVPIAWWRHLHDMPQAAIEGALRRAPSTSPSFVPTAPLVREIAGSIAKTLGGPKPDYSRPALEEPEPEVSSEWSARFDEIRRTKQGPERAAAIARLVVEELERKETQLDTYRRCAVVGSHGRRCSGPSGHDDAHRSGRFEWTDADPEGVEP